MLNKKEIRRYLELTATDLLQQINKERSKDSDEEKINLIKQGIAFGLYYFNIKYSYLTKSYKKLSMDDLYKLLDLEQGKD
tara:strand:+ start:143 stop:382 length:240 start_codon:yes stop_codon:yes gene_type:complete